jgi:mannose-6-phosphate isomerase
MKRLQASVQQYAWGKIGSHSAVAQLLSSSNIKENEPYAELWMGTHPSSPSYVINDDDNQQCVLLRDYLGSDLPFLFKVLSVNQALSIQAHPNIELAKQLHHKDPVNYKDANHKPELCCALTEFSALCAFRPLNEIVSFVKQVSELRELLGDEAVKCFENTDGTQLTEEEKKQKLQLSFSALMNADCSLVKQQLELIVKRLRDEHADTPESKLLLELYESYPDDVGCFAVYFLNVLTLQPGEALFLAPNEPHAYTSGDCIEIMACSDNVVRAGLTPKFRDVNTLCGMLTFSDNSLEGYMKYDTGKKINDGISKYDPPVPEFELYRVQFSGGNTSFTNKETSILLVINAPSDATVLSEEDKSQFTLHKGDIYLIPQNCSLNIKSPSSDEELLLFIASSNSSVSK